MRRLAGEPVGDTLCVRADACPASLAYGCTSLSSTRLKRTELSLVEDLVQQLRIDNCPPTYCLRIDLPLLESVWAESPPTVAVPITLLAPLDRLIYDRRLTAAPRDFDYTWEVYVPEAKRIRGYYALPLLAETDLARHADLRADRPKKKLRVVSRSVCRGHTSAAAIGSLARFLGLT